VRDCMLLEVIAMCFNEALILFVTVFV
jgi:hypothetical protein